MARLTPERRQQIESLYRSASQQPAGELETFLTTACGADQDLRNEVDSLLTLDELNKRMQHPAGDAATDSLTLTLTSHESGQLGPYKIEQLLGAGGMGKVYRATDTRLNRKVAVKISAELFSGRFEREARAISTFNHPNICTLYDVGPNYLVMELLDGSTLADEIKRGPLAPGASGPLRSADCRRTRGGARAWRGASGSEAAQHHGDPARRESAGFRARQDGLRSGPDGSQPGDGHARIHGAGTGGG